MLITEQKEHQKMNSKKLIVGIGVFLMSLSTNLWADTDPIGNLTNMVNQLQKQIGQMQKTINQQSDKIQRLESQPRIEVGKSSSVESMDPQKEKEKFVKNLAEKIGDSDKWLKNLKFSGDGRLRYEAFDFTSGHPSETDSRNRFRYRLRVGAEKKLSDQFKAGFFLASGEQALGTNGDNVSTNTTFDNNFSLKDIFVDRMYAIYNPNWAKVGPIEKTEIGGGKFANPFEKGSSDMIWDRDVRPEGAYEMVDLRLHDGEDLKVKAYGLLGQFILDEDSSASNNADAELYAFQAGLDIGFATPAFEKPVNWLSAISWYSFSDYTNVSNFTVGGTSLARGNSNFIGPATELDAEDFEVIELYNEFKFYPFGDTALSDVALAPFFDLATNTQNKSQQNDEALAWAFGAKLGGLKKKGDWELGYTYKRIENDAVVGAFNDSDFGLGHSGKRGSVFKMGYALTDNIQLNGTAIFVNNLATGTGSVRDEEQRRFQADLVWKFG